MSNKPPYIEVGLSREQYDLIIKTCESNMALGLNIVMAAQRGDMSMKAAAETVDLMEGYKGLKKTLEAAARGKS